MQMVVYGSTLLKCIKYTHNRVCEKINDQCEQWLQTSVVHWQLKSQSKEKMLPNNHPTIKKVEI